MRAILLLTMSCCAAVGAEAGGEAAVAPAPESRTQEPLPGPPDWSLRERASYLFGANDLAERIVQMELDVEKVIQGLEDRLAARPLQVPERATKRILDAFIAELEAAHERELQDMAAAARAYMDEVAAREGTQVTPEGVVYEVLKQGGGARPGPKDMVRVEYSGRLVDGTVFDSSASRGKPDVGAVSGPEVMRGWASVLPRMGIGDRWRVHIPPELAYGAEGRPPIIPPHSVLVLEIELLDVLQGQAQAPPTVGTGP